MSVSFSEMEAFCDEQKVKLEFGAAFERIKSIIHKFYSARDSLKGPSVHVPGHLYSCNMFILTMTPADKDSAYIVLNYTVGFTIKLATALLKRDRLNETINDLDRLFPS